MKNFLAMLKITKKLIKTARKNRYYLAKKQAKEKNIIPCQTKYNKKY